MFKSPDPGVELPGSMNTEGAEPTNQPTDQKTAPPPPSGFITHNSEIYSCKITYLYLYTRCHTALFKIKINLTKKKKKKKRKKERKKKRKRRFVENLVLL